MTNQIWKELREDRRWNKRLRSARTDAEREKVITLFCESRGIRVTKVTVKPIGEPK